MEASVLLNDRCARYVAWVALVLTCLTTQTCRTDIVMSGPATKSVQDRIKQINTNFFNVSLLSFDYHEPLSSHTLMQLMCRIAHGSTTLSYHLSPSHCLMPD